MQKRLMFVAFLLLAICNRIVAEDQISIDNFSLNSGDTKEVSVVLTNEDSYVGFQFDMYLPSGITVESFSANSSRFPEGTTPQMSQQSDGSYRFVAAALERNPIVGNEGAILTLMVKAADSIAAKDYTGYLRNIKISKTDGTGVTKAEQPFTITVRGDEAYVVLSDNTLTFYYDKQGEKRSDWMPMAQDGSSITWGNYAAGIIKVVFDSSFANCTTITSTANWFNGFTTLVSIEGIENLKTDNVTNMSNMFNGCSSLTSLDLSSFNTQNVTAMRGMFEGCSGLTSLDLSGFNTQNVTSMGNMFSGCSALTTIYVGSEWSTANVTESTDMFAGCTSLVGGMGTAYDAAHNDAAYAHIDEGPSNPGYFTPKAGYVEAPTFAWSADELTMTSGTDGATIYYTSDYYTSENGVLSINAKIAADKTGKLEVVLNNFETNYVSCQFDITLPAGLSLITNSAGELDESSYTLTSRSDGYSVGVAQIEERHYRVVMLNLSNKAFSGNSGDAILILNVKVTEDFTSGTVRLFDAKLVTESESYTPEEITCVVGGATLYQGPITVTSDVLITAYAEKDGMARSMTTVLDYPYTAWTQLVTAIAVAQNVSAQAANNDNVTADQRDSLTTLITIGQAMYVARADSAVAIRQFTTELVTMTDIIRQLVNAENEPYAVLSNENTVLTFYYDKKKEERGGIDINNSYLDYKVVSPYGTATTAVIDASFANYKPTSTAYWFQNCSLLESISGMENLMTDSVTDMSYMFYSCDSLRRVDVSGFKTDNVTDMSHMFRYCRNVTSLDVSNFKTDRVTNMTNMFMYCSKLTNLDVSGFNTQNVTDMAAMFSGCSGLTTLDVSGFKTDNVTNMREMFGVCLSLTSLDVSGFNTAKVTDMGYMFSACQSLTSLDVSNFNTSNVTNMGYMFSACNNLTSLDVSHFDTGKTTILGNMFTGCSKLTSLDVSGFNTEKVTHLNRMFISCSGLTSLDLSNFNTATVTHLTEMFVNCPNLTTIYVGEGWSTAKVEEGGKMFDRCTSLVGGKGTVYDSLHVDYTYAHIDGGPDNPGYFTPKNGYGSAAKPTFSHDGNLVFAHSTTEGATIRYTIDGEAPTDTTGVVYSNSIVVTRNCTIRAIATRENFTPSEVAEYSVDWFKVANVEFAQNGHTITLTTQTDSATIHYKLSNSESEKVYATFENPSNTNTTWDSETKTFTWSTTYYNQLHNIGLPSGDITKYKKLVVDCDIKSGERFRILFYKGGSNVTLYASNGLNEFILADTLKALHPDDYNEYLLACDEICLSGNNSVSPGEVVINDVYLATYDDEAVDQIYINPLTLDADCTIESYATRAGWLNSDTTSFVFHADGVTCSNPVFVRNGNVITITTQTENARIYYTTDGTDPTDQSILYVDSIVVDHNMTIKAITMRENYYPSQVVTFVVNWFKCELPTIEWSGDQLIATTATEGAIIEYSLTQAGVESPLDHGGEVSPLKITVTQDATINLYAVKTGWENSDTLVIDYPYTAWQQLREAIEYSMITVAMCEGSQKVKQDDVMQLKAMADMAADYYSKRQLQRNEIESMTGELMVLSAMLRSQLEAVEYAFDSTNGVLTISGGTTVAEALEAAGGSSAASVLTSIIWQNTTPLTNDELKGLDNPNMLIYVADTSLAPANRDNVIIGNDSTGYTAKKIVLADAAEGNNNFYCPQAFTAEIISYTRNFQQSTEVGVSRGWETIALPFSVQTITHEKNGVISPFGNDASSKHFWLRRLGGNGLTQATKIEANEPYLISMPNNPEAYDADYNLSGKVTFTSQDVTVPVTAPLMFAKADYSVMMVPAFQCIRRASDVWALNVGQSRDEYFEGSVFERDYRDVRPFEAYTIHSGDTPAPRFVPIKELNGGTTGIEDVRSLMFDGRGEGAWYNLNGRRLQQKPTRKGVYILNGKKTVIK